MHLPRLPALAAAAALALLACGGEPSGAPSRAHGTVRGIGAATSEVTIEHGEIPGLMDAMTMTFSVDDPTLLAGLAVGDEVDFVVKQDGDRYVVTEIRRGSD